MAEYPSISRRAPRVERGRRCSESRSSNPHGPGRIPKECRNIHSDTQGVRRGQSSKYPSIQSVGMPPRQLPLEQQ